MRQEILTALAALAGGAAGGFAAGLVQSSKRWKAAVAELRAAFRSEVRAAIESHEGRCRLLGGGPAPLPDFTPGLSGPIVKRG